MYDEFEVTQEEIGKRPPRRRLGRAPRDPYQPDTRPWWKRHWKRVVGGIFLVAGVAAAAFGLYLFLNVAKVSVNPFGFGKLNGESTGRVNILMLGVGDPGHDGENLSDTNILLSVNTNTHQVSMVSVPRDTQVTLPEGGEGKVNAALSEGGIDGAKKTFEETLGVPIHYYVKADFTALKQVVDAVGGVDVKNTTLLYDPEYPCDNNQYKICGYKLAAGNYHLDGTAALKYARCRKGTCGNDFGRAARQQEVMQQIRDKATTAGTLSNPVKLSKLVNAVGDNIKTDLSINNMMRLRELTETTDQGKIINVVLSTEDDGFLIQSNSSSNLLPAAGDFSDIQEFVKNVFTVGPIWTEHPTVEIQNGTATAGLAGTLSKKVSTDNSFISIVGLTNALKTDYATTQIIDTTGGKRPNTVNYFKSLLGVQTVITLQPAPLKAGQTDPVGSVRPNSGADILIITGADYAAKNQTSSSGSSSTGIR